MHLSFRLTVMHILNWTFRHHIHSYVNQHHILWPNLSFLSVFNENLLDSLIVIASDSFNLQWSYQKVGFVHFCQPVFVPIPKLSWFVWVWISVLNISFFYWTNYFREFTKNARKKLYILGWIKILCWLFDHLSYFLHFCGRGID